MRYYIYKYIDHNEIVYIGKSTNLVSRINQHKSDKLKGIENIWIFECNTELEMNSYEYFLIQKYRPSLNVAYNKDYSINNTITQLNFVEPNWERFVPSNFSEQNKVPIKKKKKKEIVQLKDLDFSVFPKEIEKINIKAEVNLLPLLDQKVIIFSMLNNNKFNSIQYLRFNGITEGGGMYEQIYNSINRLCAEGIMTKNGDNIILNRDIINFTLPQHYLNMVFNSNTKYFIPILNATYNKNLEQFYIPVDWLIENSGYNRASDCNKRVIKPICEVFEKHGIKTSVDIETEGRKHISYTIKIEGALE